MGWRAGNDAGSPLRAFYFFNNLHESEAVSELLDGLDQGVEHAAGVAAADRLGPRGVTRRGEQSLLVQEALDDRMQGAAREASPLAYQAPGGVGDRVAGA